MDIKRSRLFGRPRLLGSPIRPCVSSVGSGEQAVYVVMATAIVKSSIGMKFLRLLYPQSLTIFNLFHVKDYAPH